MKYNFTTNNDGQITKVIVNPDAETVIPVDNGSVTSALHAATCMEYQAYEVLDVGLHIYSRSSLTSDYNPDVGVIHSSHDGEFKHLRPFEGWGKLGVELGTITVTPIKRTYYHRKTKTQKDSPANIAVIQKHLFVELLRKGNGLAISTSFITEFAQSFFDTVNVDEADTKAREEAWAAYQKACTDAKMKRLTRRTAGKMRTQQSEEEIGDLPIKVSGRKVTVAQVQPGRYELYKENTFLRTLMVEDNQFSRSELAVQANLGYSLKVAQ